MSSFEPAQCNRSPFLHDLPSHHYGVDVSDEMDARRLQYLIDKVGVEKVIASAARYSEKYPGSKIYVSTLLKRYHIKVPVKVYAAVNVPLYRVYILAHTESNKIKIGYSGNWLNRLASFSRKLDFEGIDLDRSIGISFLGDKKTAMAAERMAIQKFSDSKARRPECIPYGAYGHNEWFSGEVYNGAVIFLLQFRSRKIRSYMSLRYALLVELTEDTPAYGPLQ